MHQTRFNGLQIAAMAGLFFSTSLVDVHAQSCPDGPMVQQYRNAAQERAAGPIDGILKSPENGSLSFAPAVGSPPPGNTPKFAAFLLPATMFIGADQVVAVESGLGGGTPVLPTAWGILLVPTAAGDCRIFLAAPANFKHLLPANDIRRNLMDVASASSLLDSLYRKRFPKQPEVKGVVEEGIEDPAGRVLFAHVMESPLLLSPQAGVLEAQLPKSVEAVAAELPPHFLWQRAMWQFAWPESLRAMTLKIDHYQKRVRPILNREKKTWTESSINKDLTALEEAMRELKPAGELAQADLGKLPMLLGEATDPMVKALYGQQIAILEREYGNAYTLLANQIESHYNALYASQAGTMPVSPERPFDAAELMAYRPKAATDVWDFQTLVIKNPAAILKSSASTGKLDAAFESATATSSMYVVFRDAPDPATGKARIQPEIVLSMPGEALMSLAAAELDKRTPQSTCEMKFNHGEIQWDVGGGHLTGSANVELEKWACIPHKWVCFRGWKPSWCTNTIKTRLFKTHGTVFTTTTGNAIGQGVSLITTVNIPYRRAEVFATNKSFQQPKSGIFTIPPVEMGGAFFTRTAHGKNIAFVVTGRMPPMDPGLAAAMREVLKSEFAEEKAK